MGLKLYNTRTRTKQEFRPLDEVAGKPQSAWNVRMYVCGPTVYDFAHIGNARPIIVFDVLYRLLKHLYERDGAKVTYARNITDVDDKINARAVELYPDMAPEEAIRKLTTDTTAQFHADVAALGCLPPTVEPRATDYIEQMKDMITALHAAEIAYVADDHVLFSVSAYGKMEGAPDYGSLARRSLDEMIAGARVEVAPYKRDAMDFVLWKPSKPGEPAWPSPLGIATPGRPGWHLECSAMSKAILGDEFDIHGGGIDLVFPHHENEVAQSCGANRTAKMANFWMHNGFLQVEGEKMSKSLGNFLTIRDLLHSWPGDVLRFQMLMTHYKQPIDWTERRCWEARSELGEWANVLRNYFRFKQELLPEPAGEVVNALCGDLNTPKAIAELRILFERAKRGGLRELLEFASSCKLIGLKNLDKPGYFADLVGGTNVDFADITRSREAMNLLRNAMANCAPLTVIAEIKNKIERDDLRVEILDDGQIELIGNKTAAMEIERLIDRRNGARQRKDWVEADRIRKELVESGVVLKDVKNSQTGEIETTWEFKR